MRVFGNGNGEGRGRFRWLLEGQLPLAIKRKPCAGAPVWVGGLYLCVELIYAAGACFPVWNVGHAARVEGIWVE